jgi:hypothetical protein
MAAIDERTNQVRAQKAGSSGDPKLAHVPALSS